jgi:hypothetical protein
MGSKLFRSANSTTLLISNFLWPPGVFWHRNVPSSAQRFTVVSVTLKSRAISAVDRIVFRTKAHMAIKPFSTI